VAGRGKLFGELQSGMQLGKGVGSSSAMINGYDRCKCYKFFETYLGVFNVTELEWLYVL
jgi:hypothetical protein